MGIAFTLFVEMAGSAAGNRAAKRRLAVRVADQDLIESAAGHGQGIDACTRSTAVVDDAPGVDGAPIARCAHGRLPLVEVRAAADRGVPRDRGEDGASGQDQGAGGELLARGLGDGALERCERNDR